MGLNATRKQLILHLILRVPAFPKETCSVNANGAQWRGRSQHARAAMLKCNDFCISGFLAL